MAETPNYSDQVSAVATGFMRSQILFAAHEGGVFPLLETERSADEVAAALSWPVRTTRMLLDGLVAIEFVGKTGGRYLNREVASACLVPGRPGYQGNYLKHQHGGWEAWSRLGEAIRTERATREEEERGPEELRHFILAMAEIGRTSAAEMLKALDLSPYRHVLDVGGGPGTYPIVFLREHPAMRATLLDRPPVIEIAREQVQAAGLESRFGYIPDDMLDTDFGTGYDLILVSNVIHMLGAEPNRELVRRSFAALEPGGLLIVKDFLPEPERTGPPFSLIFALHMLVNTGQGDTYTEDEIASWTNEAGFDTGRIVPLTAQSRLWLAKKPAG
ncbi:MAG: methyltransferase [FCB group bacterium]|jgi:SAM-dependent methyltransferase|nr:methyltransferase [FCB group bacterium]